MVHQIKTTTPSLVQNADQVNDSIRVANTLT